MPLTVGGPDLVFGPSQLLDGGPELAELLLELALDGRLSAHLVLQLLQSLLLVGLHDHRVSLTRLDVGRLRSCRFLIQTSRWRWPDSISSGVKLRITLMRLLRLFLDLVSWRTLSGLRSLNLLRLLNRNFGSLRSVSLLSQVLLICKFYLLGVEYNLPRLWVDLTGIMNRLTDILSVIVHHNHVIVVIGFLMFFAFFSWEHRLSFDVFHIFIQLFTLNILI